MTASKGKARQLLTRCSVCDLNPIAIQRVPYCFTCWPGGPVTPPPCLKCGATTNYFAAGLCNQCHKLGDPGIDSCRDCLAWGATRTHKWLCLGCVSWRAKYSQPAKGGGIGTCQGCGRTLMLGVRGVCRLCHKNATYCREPHQPFDPIGPNKHGQQLFFADMFNFPKGHKRQRPALPEPNAPPSPPHWLIPRDQQMALFPAKPDLAAHGRAGLHLRAHPDDVAPLEAVARDLAEAHHWTQGQLYDATIGLRIMLGIQTDGRAPVPASQVEALREIDLPVWSVLEVLSTAGALLEDRTPQIELWFQERVAPLPKQMATELTFWFKIKRTGSTKAPRSRPRSDITIQLQLGWALPILLSWADVGRQSLRETSRQDVLNALPAGGPQRARAGQGLRSIFRLLKAHKVTFTDPTFRVPTGMHPSNVPTKLDVDLIVARLNSTNPATALIIALLAFHGPRLEQLRRLLITDVQDGRLFLPGRTIPLAHPVRTRLATYLTERNNRWPEALNPHLFINQRTWRAQNACGTRWFHLAIGPGLTARQLREDRILNEADATGGDIRAISDLFGLSVNASSRYAHPLAEDDYTGAQPPSSS